MRGRNFYNYSSNTEFLERNASKTNWLTNKDCQKLFLISVPSCSVKKKKLRQRIKKSTTCAMKIISKLKKKKRRLAAV